MKKSIFVCAAVALLTFCLTGCGGLKSKVVGTWKIDASTLKGPGLEKLNSMASKDPSLKKLADQIEAGMKSMTISFKDDGTCAVSSASAFGQNEAGTWELKDHTIVIALKDQANTSHIPTLTLSPDGSKIHLSGGGTGQGEIEGDFVKSSK